MRIRLPKLSTRLFFLVLAASVPGFVLVAVLAFTQRRNAIESAESRAYELASLLAKNHESTLSSMRLLLAGLAALATELLDDPADCGRRLAALLPIDERVANLGVTAPDGRVLCSAVTPKVASTFAGRRWLDEVIATRRFVISEHVVGRIVGRSIVVVAYPRIVNGEVAQVLFASIDLNSLADLVKSAPTPAGTVLTLIDSGGTVLSRHPDSELWVGRRVRDEPFAQVALSMQHGTASMRGLDGVLRFYAFLPMPGPRVTEAHLAVGIPRSLALADANRSLLRSVVALTAVVLAALLFSRFMAHRLILKPNEALVRAAERLRSGDLSARSGIRQNPDIHPLASAFDAMAETVESQTRELHRSREEMRMLARRTEEQVERERRRIARAVHDDLGQALTALKLDTTWIAQRINGEDPAIGQHLQEMQRLLETTATTVRRISTELRPSVLDDLGLDAAVEWQSQEFSRRTGIGSEVRLRVDRASLPTAVATALFRILQEALTNVVRHASATHVAISLVELPDRAVLEVKDNGVGIAARSEDAAPSLGLLSMRERAQALGGDVIVLSAKPRGTIVRAHIPLDDGTPPREGAV